MRGYFSADIICSEKRTVFRERSSRKTVSFEEQIMSKDKYPRIFLKPNGGYCLYYPSNIFRNTGAKSASLSYVNLVKVCQLASNVFQHSFRDFRTDLASVRIIPSEKKYSSSVKREHTSLIAWKTKASFKLRIPLQSNSFFREHDQSELSTASLSVKREMTAVKD